MTLWFTWDPAKAATNLRKHGVSFETAKLVFADPFALSDQDRIENGEHRWRTIGLAGGVLVLLVAHVNIEHDDGDETIRITSARAATSRERQLYEQRRYDQN
jgi:uncharacterized DUF497 family protein